MKRALGLWLLLLSVGLVVAAPVSVAVFRQVNLRFDALLVMLIAPAAQVVVLLLFMPSLRDRETASPRAALAAPHVAMTAGLLLVVVCVVSALVVMRIVPRGAFDVVRGAILLIAAVAFVRARIVIPAVFFAIMAATSGSLSRIGEHLFPSQPLAFRWMVFFGIVTVIALTAILAIVARLRISAPHAATLLEWSLAPASLACLIVAGSFYQQPFITSTWALLAHVLGMAAAGLALLAGVAAQRR